MWQQEAASRTTNENGTEEGLGDCSESAPIAFPWDIQMEENHDPVRNDPISVAQSYEDLMVPSITSQVRAEDEASSDLRNSTGDSRAEVPMNVNVQRNARETLNRGPLRVYRNTLIQNGATGLRNEAEDSTAESSSGSSRRDGGVVPVWSSPASSYSDQFVGDENGIGAGSSCRRILTLTNS